MNMIERQMRLGRDLMEAVEVSLHLGAGVLVVERATRVQPHVGDEDRLRVPPQHEDLEVR